MYNAPPEPDHGTDTTIRAGIHPLAAEEGSAIGRGGTSGLASRRGLM